MVSQISKSSQIQATQIFNDFPVKGERAHNIYSSSLRTFRQPPMTFGEGIAQIFETIALLALLPFFIYTFFIASVSLLLLPCFLILFPLLLIGDLMWEMLYTVFPFFFPNPAYRGIYY